MNSKWKRVIKNEKEFNEIMLPSRKFREKLLELIEKEVNSLEVIRDYDDNNWGYKEADRKGQLYALTYIKKLIE